MGSCLSNTNLPGQLENGSGTIRDLKSKIGKWGEGVDQDWAKLCQIQVTLKEIGGKIKLKHIPMATCQTAFENILRSRMGC